MRKWSFWMVPSRLRRPPRWRGRRPSPRSPRARLQVQVEGGPRVRLTGGFTLSIRLHSWAEESLRGGCAFKTSLRCAALNDILLIATNILDMVPHTSPFCPLVLGLDEVSPINMWLLCCLVISANVVVGVGLAEVGRGDRNATWVWVLD